MVVKNTTDWGEKKNNFTTKFLTTQQIKFQEFHPQLNTFQNFHTPTIKV